MRHTLYDYEYIEKGYEVLIATARQKVCIYADVGGYATIVYYVMWYTSMAR